MRTDDHGALRRASLVRGEGDLEAGAPRGVVRDLRPELAGVGAHQREPDPA